MNFTLKTLLVLSGTALLSMPVLRAQHGAGGSHGGLAARPSFGARSATSARSGLNSSLHGGRFAGGRGYYHGRGGHGSYGHHHYGRYYYLGGIPYFYPFYGYGFGYPGYYGGFYGNGFYGDGYSGPYGGAYEGRIASNRGGDDNEDRDQPQQPGPSLPSAVQRQLAKRGYYKGSVDGQFGPASREALGRFQKSQGLKSTGKVDEETLNALGFTDQR